METTDWTGIKGIVEARVLGSTLLRDRIGPALYGRQHTGEMDRLIGEALSEGGVVADFGAGSGFYTIKAASVGPNVAVKAIDLSEPMLAHLEKRVARSRLDDRVTVLRGNVCATTLPSGSADLAIAANLFHEMVRPYDLASEIVRVLRPGGLAIVTEIYDSPRGRAFLKHHRQEVHGAYKDDELEQLLSDAGMSVTSSSKGRLRILITAVKSLGGEA